MQMRRTSSITGGGSSPAYAQMSAEQQEREAALTGQLASLEARAAAAAAERDAIRSRVLQLETELRQKDAALEETMTAAAASGGRDKQVSQECLLNYCLWYCVGCIRALLRCMVAAAAASGARDKQVSVVDTLRVKCIDVVGWLEAVAVGWPGGNDGGSSRIWRQGQAVERGLTQRTWCEM
jgi:hypothetical protein